MNAARRNRQKDNRENAHDHLNRAARTDAEGKVARCLFCRPVRNDNEQAHVHGNQVLRRPVSGALRWAASPHGKKVPAAENLERISAIQDEMGLGTKQVKAAMKKIELEQEALGDG